MRGLPFYVDERTIVPRSFIGEIAGFAFRRRRGRHLADRRSRESVERVLDLCTGSGCLAILAARHFPNATVDAVDISADALEVAARNVADHGLDDRLTLHRGDLFAPLGDNSYDLIISNPPYVDAEGMAGAAARVPRRAEDRVRRRRRRARHRPPHCLTRRSSIYPAGWAAVRDRPRPRQPRGRLSEPAAALARHRGGSEGEVFWIAAADLGRGSQRGRSGRLEPGPRSEAKIVCSSSRFRRSLARRINNGAKLACRGCHGRRARARDMISHFDDLHRHLHGAGRSLVGLRPVLGGGHQRIGIGDRGAHRPHLPDPLQRRLDAAARPQRCRRPDRGSVARHRGPRPPGRRIRPPAGRGRGPGHLGQFHRRRPDAGRWPARSTSSADWCGSSRHPSPTTRICWRPAPAVQPAPAPIAQPIAPPRGRSVPATVGPGANRRVRAATATAAPPSADLCAARPSLSARSRTRSTRTASTSTCSRW